MSATAHQLGAGVLLASALVVGGCRPDVDPRVAQDYRVIPGGNPGAAPEAMRHYGCVSCHTIPGVRGANSLVGPPLTGFAQRRYIAGRVPNAPESLVQFILNPQSVQPGTAMPDMGVSDQAARDMAAYLYTLR